MLARLVAGTEWSELTDYLSPSFFSVVPPFKLALELKSLAANFVSRSDFGEVCTAINGLLAGANMPLRIADKDAEPTAHRTVAAATEYPDKAAVHRQGELLLQLYFTQLLRSPACLLDYRHARFFPDRDGQRLLWRPSPLFIAWDAEFIQDIRSLYRGFYEDDEALFARAAGRLGLATAKDELTAHFGANQGAVTFKLATFRATFHEVFVAAKRGKQPLPANFLGFGAGLACLYEHLESLGGAFDVKAAYFAARHDPTFGHHA